MAVKRVEEFAFREFRVVVGVDSSGHVAVGYDGQGDEIDRTSPCALEDAKVEIKTLLARKSEDFVDFPSAIRLFRRAYPEGFEDPFFYDDERKYKIDAHKTARDLLGKDQLSNLMAADDCVSVSAAARKVFINLVFPNEAIAFSEFLKRDGSACAEFAHHLFALLHGDAFDEAFDRIAVLLKPFGAAKWPILTYWPFILWPDKHMFLKPEVAQECAWRLGEDFGYESYPRSEVYRRYLNFVTTLRKGIAPLKPRDNIDVQTFMYAIGKRGFVRHTEQARLTWEAKGTAQ